VHTQTEHPDRSAVAVTLSPERGARMVRLQNEIPEVRMVRLQHEIADRLDRPATAPVIVPENPVSNDLVSSRPRLAPLPWMTAITDRVNALWNAIYDRQPVVASALDRELSEVLKRPIPTCDRQEIYVFPVFTVRPDPHLSTVPGTRLWRLDSDTAIDLDQIQTKKLSPELDFRIHPPLRQQSAIRMPTDLDATLPMAPIRDECRTFNARPPCLPSGFGMCAEHPAIVCRLSLRQMRSQTYLLVNLKILPTVFKYKY